MKHICYICHKGVMSDKCFMLQNPKKDVIIQSYRITYILFRTYIMILGRKKTKLKYDCGLLMEI